MDYIDPKHITSEKNSTQVRLYYEFVPKRVIAIIIFYINIRFPDKKYKCNAHCPLPTYTLQSLKHLLF